MRILMIQNNEIKPQTELINFLEKIGQVNEINFANLKTENFPEYDAYDLIILSGSGYKELNGNEKLYKIEMDLIEHTTTKIIGICFGLEIIANTFGERLEKLNEKIFGLNEIIFQDHKYTVWQNHIWALKQISESSKLETLSKSRNGIEIIKVKDKDIFGVQFHPEHIENKNDGQKIFEEIFTLING